MVRLLPSGPRPVSMTKTGRAILRLHILDTSNPEGRNLIDSIWLDSELVTPPQSVAPTNDDFDV